MVIVSVRYRFSQNFDVPPRAAYRWCTDYDPDDIARMGKEGKRKIERLSDDALLLTDTVGRGEEAVTKQRLVRLFPEKLCYTNTHVSGPNVNSQFLYEILPRVGGGSKLEFTGALLYKARRAPSRAEVAEVARRERDADSHTWELLEREMAKDLAK